MTEMIAVCTILFLIAALFFHLKLCFYKWEKIGWIVMYVVSIVGIVSTVFFNI